MCWAKKLNKLVNTNMRLRDYFTLSDSSVPVYRKLNSCISLLIRTSDNTSDYAFITSIRWFGINMVSDFKTEEA